MPIAEDPEPRPSEGREPDGTAPTGPDGKDPFADLVLDEEFVRGASVKEQTGRTRMLAAQWKHTPPVDPGGRRSVNDGPAPKKRFARKGRPVDAWGNPRPRRSLEWRTPLFVLLAVALVLAALNVDGLRSWYSTRFGDGSNGTPAASGPVPTVAPETARPTAAPSAAAEQRPTVDHPWAGSPAEGWPTDIAAFAPKETPGAVGVFTAEEVAEQVELVKQYLAAANLDPAVVAGGRPTAALAMLDADEQNSAVKALAKPSAETDPTHWFSRFDPAEAIPVNSTVKLQGMLTVEGDGEKGVLVHADFTYVYALRPGPDAAKRAAAPKPTPTPRPSTPGGKGGGGGTGGTNGGGTGGGTARPVGWTVPAADVAGDTWTTRTVVRRVETFRFYDPKRFDVIPKKLNINSRSEIGNSACDVYDGYLHPQFDQFAASFGGPEPAPSGTASDPYDRSKDLSEGDGECGTVTRS
ncbi:hypothetical protein ABZW10_01170 [Kitasatospora sp. NPDC004723]|uniref:SCO2583/SCO2584 N-terminal domain-containing protein n=1 Tax=Kitasatospora sp. NPDC004723 TaxID=3154288 RepID=UPI0033A60B83